MGARGDARKFGELRASAEKLLEPCGSVQERAEALLKHVVLAEARGDELSCAQAHRNALKHVET